MDKTPFSSALSAKNTTLPMERERGSVGADAPNTLWAVCFLSAIHFTSQEDGA